MTVPELGRLTRVDIRSIWLNEATDFTPWLSQEENLALLGDAIDLELELAAREQNVGPFRADILCRDVAADNWVLIENQLEPTDHVHLGQLITYAAGLKAVSIVWIARNFTEQHRAALDWLNEITDEQFNFFGIEIDAERIGDSPPAPRFNVVCRPNDWSKSVGGGKRAIRNPERLAFWQAFHDYMEEHAPDMKPSRATDGASLDLPLEGTGFALALWCSYCKGQDRANEMGVRLKAEEPVILWLQQDRDGIEQVVGSPVFIRAKKGKAAIGISRNSDITDREDWPNQFHWLLDKTRGLRAALTPRLRQYRETEMDDDEDSA